MATSRSSLGSTNAGLITKVAGGSVGVLILVSLAFTGHASAQPDEEIVRYNAPPLSGTHFAHCVGAGSFDLSAPWNQADYYAYPSGQRSYVFRGDGKDADLAALKVNTKDGVEMTVNGMISFRLNTDCKTLRAFHEAIGIKYQAWQEDGHTSDGWHSMLDTYMGQSVQRAVSDATVGLTWQDLYSNPAVKAEWERKVKDLLPQYVKQASQGEYFDQFSITIQKPEIPEDLQNALRSAQVAAQQTKAQQQKNAQVTSELQSIKELVAVLGPNGYNTYQAIKSGQVNVMPIPQGSSIMVPGSTDKSSGSK